MNGSYAPTLSAHFVQKGLSVFIVHMLLHALLQDHDCTAL